MPGPHLHAIRVHGRVLFVVVSLLTALVPLAWPAGARGAVVAPVPVAVWPLQPAHTVMRAFDPPDLPFGSGHRGVDLLGTPGEAVRSALPGRVTYAGWLAGRGVVVVDHGATRTTYEPVTPSVRVGDLVSRGQRLGTLERFGSHCFPRACLHWGWIRGDTYLDPLLLVGDGPIRLLPLAAPAGPGLPWRPSAQPYAWLVGRPGLRPPRHPTLPIPVLTSAPGRTLAEPRTWARRLLM